MVLLVAGERCELRYRDDDPGASSFQSHPVLHPYDTIVATTSREITKFSVHRGSEWASQILTSPQHIYIII
jgi:hypothetical protein